MPECYTKKKNDGGTYTTCVEFQNKPKKKKLKVVAPKPKKQKLKIVEPRRPLPSITITEDSRKSFSTSDATNVIGPYQPTAVGFKIGKNPELRSEFAGMTGTLGDYLAQKRKEEGYSTDEEDGADPESSDSEEEGNWWESEGSEVEPFNYKPEIYGPNKFLLNKETKEVFDYEGERVAEIWANGRVYFNTLGENYERKLIKLKKRTELIDRLVREGKGDELQEILRRVKADPSKTGVEHYADMTYEKKEKDKGPVVQADDEEGPLEAGTPANKDSLFYQSEFKKLVDEETIIDKAMNPRKDLKKLRVENANHFINTLIGSQGTDYRRRKYGITERYSISRGLKSAIRDLDYRTIGRALSRIATEPGWGKVINEGILERRRDLEYSRERKLGNIAKRAKEIKEEAKAELSEAQDKASTRVKKKYKIGDIITLGGGSFDSGDAMRGYVYRSGDDYKITGFTKTGVSLKEVDGTDKKFRRYTDF